MQDFIENIIGKKYGSEPWTRLGGQEKSCCHGQADNRKSEEKQHNKKLHFLPNNSNSAPAAAPWVTCLSTDSALASAGSECTGLLSNAFNPCSLLVAPAPILFGFFVDDYNKYHLYRH